MGTHFLYHVSIIFLLSLFVFPGLEVVSQTVVPDKNLKELNAIRIDLQKRIKEGKIPSASIGVFQNGRIIWRESFGWADRRKKIKATPNTVYALASLSKSITATGIYKLAEQGKLSIDSPINKHLNSVNLKYYQGKPNEYKIFHLLNMTAGIPHYWHYRYDDSKEKFLTVQQQIGAFGFAAFKPGEVHHYSNFSYAVLDQIIADASAKSSPDFMRTHIFEPAGMKNTWMDRSNIPSKSNTRAKGYNPDNSEVPSNTFIPRGGAGYYSTVNDLLNYSLIHLKRKPVNGEPILKASAIDKNHEVLKEMPHRYYANGWGVLKTAEGNTTLLSNGAIAGAASTLLVIPESDISIVCLVNMTVGNSYTDQIGFDIAEALIPNYKENINKIFAEVGPSFEPFKFKAAESIVGQWRGYVVVDERSIPIRLNFSKDGKIDVSIDGEKEKPMRNPMTETGLIIGDFDSKLSSKRLEDRDYSLSLSMRHNGNRLYGIIHANIKDKRPW